MRILLINICLRYDSVIKHIPVGLSCIATALDRAGFRPDILDIDLYRYTDEQVDDFLKKNTAYDIIGFGNIISGYKHTKRLAAQVKDVMPNALVVVGNTVATSIPKLLLEWIPQIDIAVIGEGDRTIVEIAEARAKGEDWKGIRGIAYREKGGIVVTGKREGIDRMDDIPLPDYSLFEVEKYLSVSYLTVPEALFPDTYKTIRALPVNTARGCPYSCTFCSHAFKAYKYRCYSFGIIVRCIASLQEKYRINYVHFWDELTIFSPERLRELCDAIEKAGIRFNWSITSRVNTFTHKDLALLQRSTGLGAVSMGAAFESADPGILKAMNKRIVLEKFFEQAAVANKAGIKFFTSLVFGYPQETVKTIKKTIDVCRQLAIYPSAGYLLPFPGTIVYEQALAKGLIKDEEEYLLSIGDRQDLHINLTEMPDDVFTSTVKEELIKLKNDLRINMPDNSVIKTGRYKIANK